RFPLVAVCKLEPEGSEKIGEISYRCAKAIKEIDPQTKVIVYLNTILDYPGSVWHTTFQDHPEWALKNKRDEVFLVRKTLKVFDQSNSAVRDWWTTTAAVLCGQAPIDGIFADTVAAIGPKKGLGRALVEEKHEAVIEGMHLLFEEARDKMGAQKLMIYNGLRGDLENWDGGLSYLKHTSGAILEHFGGFTGRNADGSLDMVQMMADIELIRQAALMGKIVLVKGWPGDLNWMSKGFMEMSQEQKREIMRERITFPLAAFLVAAEKYCYFSYTFGYLGSHGLFEWFDQYDKPLGSPKGPAQKEGWVYTREFEHASVWVDLANEKARIDWEEIEN
ncbi:MAG: putative glycoside hydrolase, partial [Planctomycetota bacterium]